MVNSPEILPGRSHGQRRLATHKELATIKHEHIQVCLQVECSGCLQVTAGYLLCVRPGKHLYHSKNKSNVISLQKF